MLELPILFVEDDVMLLKGIQTLCRLEGINLLPFNSPYEALERAKEQRFLGLITDMNMPDMNGLQLVVALRALPFGSGLPVVFLTGDNLGHSEILSLEEEYHPCKFCSKPLMPSTSEKFRDFMEFFQAYTVSA